MIVRLSENLYDIYIYIYTNTHTHIHGMICMFCTFKFSKTAHIFIHTNDNDAECKPLGYIYIHGMICMFCTYKFSKTAHIFTHTYDNAAE